MERTAEIAKKLHENSLKLWAVTYDLILKFDNQAYLDLFDIITFWTWKARNLDQVDANISETIRRAKGKDVYAGCYLFDYGDNRPMDAEVMERYLEKCRHLCTRHDQRDRILNCVGWFGSGGMPDKMAGSLWDEKI